MRDQVDSTGVRNIDCKQHVQCIRIHEIGQIQVRIGIKKFIATFCQYSIAFILIPVTLLCTLHKAVHADHWLMCLYPKPCRKKRPSSSILSLSTSSSCEYSLTHTAPLVRTMKSSCTVLIGCMHVLSPVFPPSPLDTCSGMNTASLLSSGCSRIIVCSLLLAGFVDARNETPIPSSRQASRVGPSSTCVP